MLGTVGACPIEIVPLEIIELELTNFDSTSAIFKTIKLKKKKGGFGLWEDIPGLPPTPYESLL